VLPEDFGTVGFLNSQITDGIAIGDGAWIGWRIETRCLPLRMEEGNTSD
jgi:hypothetical protein